MEVYREWSWRDTWLMGMVCWQDAGEGRSLVNEEGSSPRKKKGKKKPFIPATTGLSVQWIMREPQGDAMQNDGKSHI